MRKIWSVILILVTFGLSQNVISQVYKIVDTGQQECYDTLHPIDPPLPGAAFYGQDAQYSGNQPSYQDNGDGTVTDLVTGLIWQKGLVAEKMTYDEAVAGADTCNIGGYSDWRLPTIKELYSLIDFQGVTGLSAETSVPFINTGYFDFRYGDESAGERFIDAQYASSTEYVGTTMNGNFTIFGVNFADGRIKGYGTVIPRRAEKTFEVKYVRGNPDYGFNDFEDNGDGTVSDASTGLMWTKMDNGSALKWEEALAWVEQRNEENLLGYNDWRLPNAKELQSIVDYTRSLQTTNSPAINPIFECSAILDEGDELNYPFYWTGTTHADGPPENQYVKAVYVCFGEALGFMEIPPNSGNYQLMDVHGAGAQRSDPKFGDPENFPHGFGPQGDVIRIFNYVRMVRDDSQSSGMNENGTLPDWIRVFPNPVSDQLTVMLDKIDLNPVKIALLDTSGKEVFSSFLLENEIHILISGYRPGIYTLSVSEGNEMYSEKIVVL